MNEHLGYIKYISVGFVLSVLLGWGDIGIALVLGFFGALGGFFARFITNRIKKRWKIFRHEKS